MNPPVVEYPYYGTPAATINPFAPLTVFLPDPATFGKIDRYALHVNPEEFVDSGVPDEVLHKIWIAKRKLHVNLMAAFPDRPQAVIYIDLHPALRLS